MVMVVAHVRLFFEHFIRLGLARYVPCDFAKSGYGHLYTARPIQHEVVSLEDIASCVFSRFCATMSFVGWQPLALPEMNALARAKSSRSHNIRSSCNN